MFANAGDHIVVHSKQVGAVDRAGTILEVRGADGRPPYIIQWENTEGLCLVYPGGDAEISHTTSQTPQTPR